MEKLIHDAQALFNIHLVGRQILALGAYEKELMSWNEKFNLTAIRDAEAIRTKHFLDSFSCVLAWKANPPHHLVDVGTGAGFASIGPRFPHRAISNQDGLPSRRRYAI